MEQKMINQNKQNQGFTLIEVLISMIILAVGLLGLMTLQLQALQTNTNANIRTQASIAAYDMSERIKANIKNYGDYDDVDETGTPSGSAIAVSDITKWRTYLADNLPEGKGKIKAAPTASDGLDITVTWKENDRNDKSASASTKTKSFTLRARFN